jgi:hemerythrin-like metal-binding domain
MAVQWTEDLRVGIEQIDNQHKELFKRVNDLFTACNERRGKQEVGYTLNYLYAYVHEHFHDEQEYQKKLNYPEYQTHLKLHNDYIKDVEELKKEFERDGATLGFIIKFNKNVVDWLVNHIRVVDKRFGEFVRNQSKA